MITFSDLQISPAQVYPLELITVTVLATNSPATNGDSGAVTVDVHLTGWWRLTQSVTLAAGESKVVTFTFRPSTTGTPGVHSIIVEGLEGYVEVLPPGEPPDGEPPETTGTITVTTSPVGASIFVDGTWAGHTDPEQSLVATTEAGLHIVSFGEVDGYTAPGPQSIEVIAGSDVSVFGEYVAGAAPPPSKPLPWLWIAGGVALALVLLLKARGKQ